MLLLSLIFAAFLDIPLTPPSYIPAAGTKTAASIAANGDGFFAAWADGRDAAGIYGTRIAADGHALDPTGIFLCSGIHPKVLWNGRYWLVLSSDQSNSRIYATTVDRDGHVVTPQTLIVTAAAAVFGAQYAATNGSNTVVAYLRSDGAPYGSLEVAVLDENGAALAVNVRLPFTPAANHFAPSIASNGDGYFVEWFVFAGTNSGIEGVRLDANGTPIDTAPILIHSTAVVGDAPSIYSDGHDYLFAALLNDFSTTLLRRINADGTLGTRIAQPQSSPLLAWTGDRYVMLYGDASHLAMRALDRDGNSLDQGKTISVASNQNFALAANGANVMLVQAQSEVVATPVDGRRYTPSPPSIIAFTATPQDASAIAAGNNGFEAAWQEAGNAYVASLDANGNPLAIKRLGQGAHPRLAWNGKSYDVAFVQPNGTLSILSPSCATDLDLASNGDITLLVWSDCNSGRIIGLRLRDGQPLDAVPLVMSRHVTEYAHEVHPRVAWNGSAFVVVWQDEIPSRALSPIPATFGEIHALRLTPELTFLDFLPIEIADAAPSSRQPEIASSGLESLIVYTRGNWLEARLLANDGTLSAPITTRPLPDFHSNPAVTWNAGSYFVAWQQSSFQHDTLFAARITRNGDITPSIPLAAESSKPMVASDGHLLLLYDRLATEPLYGGVMRAFLRMLDAPRVHAAGR